ncbi:hypothetical protein FPV67DRAFT_404980 [Lyophyllum atratum]|nr:hypothetical protein FPV67DRAFT_404980 [Lyophyllum atratum]
MHRIRSVRAHAERRALLPNVLTDVLGSDLPTPTPLSLGLPDLTSLIPLHPLTTSASGSLSDSSSSSVATSTSSSSSSSSSVQSSSSIPTSTQSPTPTPAPSVFETTSGGKVHTITTFTDAAPSSTQSAVPPPKGFLQNKVLSGVVFSLVGLIGLVIILAIATFALRRKRNNKLQNEALSFDPSSTMDSTHHYGSEKGRFSMGFGSPRTSDDHNNHGATGYGNTFGANHTQGRRPEQDISFPQPPARVLSPQGYARGGSGENLPPPGVPEGINWGPTLTPFTAPLPPAFGASNQTESTVDERTQSQNRILKIANK